MADRAEKTLQIQNELGLHARAATRLVQTASKYPCEVTVTKDGHEVTTETDADGRFRAVGLRDGVYAIFVEEFDDDARVADAAAGSKDLELTLRSGK